MKIDDLNKEERHVTKSIWEVLSEIEMDCDQKADMYNLLHNLRCVSKKQAYLEISNKALASISFTN